MCAREVLRVPRTTVRERERIVSGGESRENNSYRKRKDLAWPGPKRCTTARGGRLMVNSVLRNRFILVSEIRSQLKTARKVTVSLRTARRRLAERNGNALRPGCSLGLSICMTNCSEQIKNLSLSLSLYLNSFQRQ